MEKRKILFIAPLYPDRAPSQRFRFEQYLEYFKQNNFDYTFSHLIDKKSDKIFYSKGNILKKTFLLFKFIYIRLKDVLKANKFDIIFIQREAFFLGTTVFEYLLSKSKAKLIFDFDDSIWIPNVSDANQNLNWLKNSKKTSKIIFYSNLVIAGNQYLKDYALKFNKNVIIIPTTIDTSEYKKSQTIKSDKICIGWSGSITTIQHFQIAIPFLKVIKERYKDKIHIKVIGDSSYVNYELDIKGIKWNKESEIDELSSFDIGIMPLPDDKWAKGKCGLKGLQYMSLEIPTIMSPVGVNTEIIENGVNGFLANSNEEWIEKLSLLIENEELRLTLGKAGYQTVVEKYSVESQKEKYVKWLSNL